MPSTEPSPGERPRERRRNRAKRGIRARLPIIAVVLCCVAAVVVAVSGAASSIPGLQFLPPGHWVFNAALQSVFHVDGATASVDAVAQEVPGSAGSLVVQGETSGYVVGDSRITEFGKSSLEVSEDYDAPSDDAPVGVEVAGGPYLVYQGVGKVVRLGEQVVTINAGGPVGNPVATSDGTLWLPRTGDGLLCRLAPGADRVTCPVRLPKDHSGAMSVVDGTPVFVDTAADAVHTVEADGLGPARPLGVDASERARVAGTDLDGKVVILDGQRLHLVATRSDAAKPRPVTVDLPAGGRFDGPVTTGSVVAIIDRESGTLLTYDADGKAREQSAIPQESGAPRLTRGEDERVYVDSADGEHVLVVDRDGAITDVPVVEDLDATTEADEDREQDQNPPRGGTPSQENPAQNPPRNPQQSSPPQQAPKAPQQQDLPEPETPVVPATPPGAPAGVAATPGNGSATVTWGAAADNRAPITGFTISWPGGATTAAPGDRAATVAGLANGTSYVFTVTATNSRGTGPGASSNPVVPAVRAASSPQNVSVSYNPDTRGAVLSWSDPADLGDGAFVRYDATVSGAADNVTVSGNSATFDNIQTSGLLTFSVNAVTSAPDGQELAGAVGTATAEGNPTEQDPLPTLNLVRGADSESDACVAPNCSWLNVTLAGFEPNTEYTITADASEWGNDFSEPCITTTDATGAATCNDTRFDGAGQEIFVCTTLPDGSTVESNRVYWEPR